MPINFVLAHNEKQLQERLDELLVYRDIVKDLRQEIKDQTREIQELKGQKSHLETVRGELESNLGHCQDSNVALFESVEKLEVHNQELIDFREAVVKYRATPRNFHLQSGNVQLGYLKRGEDGLLKKLFILFEVIKRL